tara:strand:+ start:4073 stop:4219 length:147 start_codon:yes stop_codon:yes gene_type:complete
MTTYKLIGSEVIDSIKRYVWKKSGSTKQYVKTKGRMVLKKTKSKKSKK